MSLEKIFGVLPGPDLERDRRPGHKRGLVPEGPLSCPAFQAREQQAQVSVDTWRQARREGGGLGAVCVSLLVAQTDTLVISF